MDDNMMTIENLKKITPEQLATFSDDEQLVLKQVISEIAETGTSKTLKDIWYSDYEEIPVDIDTFIDDPNYLGDALGGSLYPFWRGQLRNMFAPGANYSECFTGDTKIPLLSGIDLPISDVVINHLNGVKQYTYSVDPETRRIVPGLITNVMSHTTDGYYKVTLDNDEIIKVTGNHKFYLSNRSHKLVKNLVVGDKLYPFDRRENPDKDGYEQSLVIDKETHEPGWINTHEMISDWVAGPRYPRMNKSKMNSIQTHHKDEDKRNNQPENLDRITTKMHIKYHKDHLNNAAHRGELWAVSDLQKRAIKGSHSRWSDPMQRIKASLRRELLNNGITDKVKRDQIIKDRLSDTDYIESHYGANFTGRDSSTEANEIQLIRTIQDRDESHKTEKLKPDQVQLYKAPKPWFYKDSLTKESFIYLMSKCYSNKSAYFVLDETNPAKYEKEFNLEASDYYYDLPDTFPTGKGAASAISSITKWYDSPLDKPDQDNYLSEKYDLSLEELRLLGMRLSETHKLVTQGHEFATQVRSTEVRNLLQHTVPYRVVTEIEYVNEKTTVYDLEIAKYHNFSLSSGINVSNCILTGGIGLGKSTVADVGMAYILYKLMCLKNPQEYYGLNASATISFAFFNITLANSYGVAYGKIQSMLKNSPWFLQHGSLVGRTTEEYVPGKNIRMIIGSKSEHVIGTDVFCLTGDTVVQTTRGPSTLEELADAGSIRVYQYDTNTHNVVVSNPTYVRKTREVTDLIKFTMEDNTVIKCTRDHPLLVNTDEGERYIPASQIHPGDDIVTI